MGLFAGVADFEVGLASDTGVTLSVGLGCTIIAACMPANAPRSSNRILPPPPISSAGVPMTCTVSPTSSATAAAAMPAPAAMAAMMLCPQACPIPGRQSYSAQMARCSGPLPARAKKAVGRSQIRGDRKARVRQDLGKPGRSTFFLKADLWVGMNAVTQGDQAGAHCIQACVWRFLAPWSCSSLLFILPEWLPLHPRRRGWS